MTQQQDPSVQWARHLSRLDPSLREAVVGALRHSISTGFPASERAVVLLVDYALGEISADAYAAGILSSLGFAPDDADRATRPDETSAPPAPPTPIRRPPAVSREDAVHAYVTGQIDVGEFLRIARA